MLKLFRSCPLLKVVHTYQNFLEQNSKASSYRSMEQLEGVPLRWDGSPGWDDFSHINSSLWGGWVVKTYLSWRFVWQSGPRENPISKAKVSYEQLWNNSHGNWWSSVCVIFFLCTIRDIIVHNARRKIFSNVKIISKLPSVKSCAYLSELSGTEL